MPNSINITAGWNVDSFFIIPSDTNFVFYNLDTETKLAAYVKRSDSEAITVFLLFP